MDKRRRKLIGPNIEKAQCGFIKVRSTEDHIWTKKQVTKNSQIYMAFLDLAKAFDSLPRRIIRVSGELIQGIKSLYSKTWNYVRSGNKQSKEFRVKEDLIEGGVFMKGKSYSRKCTGS